MWENTSLQELTSFVPEPPLVSTEADCLAYWAFSIDPSWFEDGWDRFGEYGVRVRVQVNEEGTIIPASPTGQTLPKGVTEQFHRFLAGDSASCP